MASSIDTAAIEEHIRGILIALGDDPEREGLKDTPKRVAKMYEEVFAGMCYSNHEIARVCDMVARRLQLQERIGKEIADIISEIAGCGDVAVIIEGYHSCVNARGIKKNNTKTRTVELRGEFQKDPSLQVYLM